MQNDLLTVNDMCEVLRIGKTTAYKLLKDKVVKHGKIGKRILIKRSSLNDYIEKSISE